jgi:hypothetical protein
LLGIGELVKDDRIKSGGAAHCRTT